MNNTKTLEEMLWVFLPSVAQIVSKKMNISLQKADEIIYIWCTSHTRWWMDYEWYRWIFES